MEVTEEIKELVWGHSTKVKGYDPDLFRKDSAGAWISFGEFGNRNSQYGWEVDHIYPTSLGGDDQIENLRAMQWENNVSKGNDYPVYIAAVTACQTNNIKKDSQRIINTEKQEKLKKIYNI